MATSSTISAPMRAGGRATEAGMAFQAAVATWFAVHMLVRMPVGGRFGINNSALPVAIRLETGDGLDDIEITQSDGGTIHVQCKTSANLGTGPRAPLTKTIGQLARWLADAKAAGDLPDVTRNVAVLAVRADAARTLDDLEAGCRAFDLGGSWATTRSQRNKAEQAALGTFETIAIPAWSAHCDAAPDDSDLTHMARIFRIARFTMVEGDSDWREASRLLGQHLFGSDTVGDAPLRDLLGIVRDLIGSGAPADRNGLLRALRRRGHHDISAPRFEADVARLEALTQAELARLSVHTRLPLGSGIPITRESEGPLLAAIQSESLLVVGEPGAGKTGTLVHAAQALREQGETVVFLSVDRFPGVAIAADLASELGLAHPLVEALGAIPGAGRKILIVDALDAARGGPSEGVFATLIEGVRQTLADDWIMVASIRTFDLRNGRRFRQAFAGAPADPDHAEPGLSSIRHFLVPRLSKADLTAAGTASDALAKLLASAPPRLAELLQNIFNLSLAAQLLADGANPRTFAAIRTQSGLIDAYENTRLDTTLLQQAAATAVAEMASRRRLSIRKVTISHAQLDAVIQRGVLAESGDLVNFAHHVLFDHIAGRFHLAWDDPDALIAQIVGDTSTALLLAPALRFAVERLWRSDQAGRPQVWRLVIGIYSEASVDPVLSNVAIRIVVENIEDESDIAGLTTQLAATPSSPVLATLLGRLANFAAMDIRAVRSVSSVRAIAWARLASALIATGERALIYPAHVLLHVLFEHGDLGDPNLLDVFGNAARNLLTFTWSTNPPLASISVNAIRFVGKSFASNPTASRALLDRILREPHFSQFADREASWLAEQIRPITCADPDFTIAIYAGLFGQTINDDSKSWFGGQPSRIMPLSSNRRQDYEHCLWHLSSAMGDVLRIAPAEGTRALIEARIGKAAMQGYGSDKPKLVSLGDTTIELRGHDSELNAWDEEEDKHASSSDTDLLRHYVQFLRDSDAATFSTSVTAASRDYATDSVWTRIFGVGSERVGEVGDLLWPFVERPDFLKNNNTLRDAVRFVGAAWPTRSGDSRIRFETMALDQDRFDDERDRTRWRRILGRVFKLVPEEALELEKTRALRRELEVEGLLTKNEPLYRITTSWGERSNFLRSELQRAGVDVDSGSSCEVLDTSEALSALVESTPPDSSPADLAILWNAAIGQIELLDTNTKFHELLDRSAWGTIANAVERIASSPNFQPGADGLPDLAAVFAVLRRLSTSPYPEPREVQQ